MRKRILSLLLSFVLAIGLLPFTASNAAAADTAANFTNLVIFCRFSDENEEFIDTKYANTSVMDIIDNTYNTSQYSVADYFRTVSGGKMNMQTLYLLDTNGASLQLSQPRGYYAKKTDDNPIGFESGSGNIRISELMQDWGTAVNTAIKAGAVPVDAAGNKHSFAELDKNKDGQIDLITVIYKNTEQTNLSVAHADPLWDYHYTYNGVTIEENSVTYTSNHYVQLTCNYTNSNGLTLYQDGDNRVILGTSGKICHETTHGLGLLDLYGGSSDSNKVGYMSLMSKHTSPIGQFLSAKEREALGWLDGQVQTMSGNGSYTLRPADSTTGTVAYKVDLSTGKTLYLEYRQFDQPNNRYDYYKKDITYIQTGWPNSGTKYKSGLICYFATTDRTIPSYGHLEVVSNGIQATKTDCAVGLDETLRDKIYSDGQWIDITVTAMDANSLTFSITGLPKDAEKTLSSVAISGNTSMIVPTQANTAATLNLTATANYSDGSSTNVTSDAAWSLTEEYAGVSISDGVVTVTPAAAAGSVTIQAEYQGKKDTHTITLTSAKEDIAIDVTVNTDKNNCTYGYTEVDAPIFTANVDGVAEGTAVTYEWYVDDIIQNGKTNASFSFPIGKNVGTYTVKCKASVNGSADTSEGVTVTVKKATPTITTPLTAAVTYGDTVENTAISGAMSAAGSFAWKNVSSYGDATDGTPKTLKATFMPTDTANYNSVDDLDVSVTVNKATYGNQTATGTAKYGNPGEVDLSGLIQSGGTAASVSVTKDDNLVLNGTPTMDGNTLQFAFANDSALTNQTAEITVSVTGCKNYTNYDIIVTVIVADKTAPAVTPPTAKDLTYNGANQTLINTAATTGGTLQYRLDNSTWSAELPQAKNADTYTVYYRVVGDDDYADMAANSIPVTISKKAVTVKPKSITVTQGNALPAFALEYDGIVSGESLNSAMMPAFTCYEADGSTPVSNKTAAGTYTITWTNVNDFDFDSETNYAVTKEYTATLTISPKSDGGNSGGNNNGNSNNGGSNNGNSNSGNNSSGSGSSSNTGSNTTVKNPDTSTITTPTDKNDNAKFTVSVPKNDAQNGEIITLPIDKVSSSNKREDAQEIKINVPVDGATVEIPVKNPTPGTVIVIVDKNGNETVMPSTKLTENGVSITLTKDTTIKVVENSKDFSDVKNNDYFSDAVAWASSRNITGGNSATTFGPDDSCTRAQLVTFLWRAAEQPEAKSESNIADVAQNAYYTKAVAWAFENNIVDGYSNGLFGSEDTITREQVAVILYRFAQLIGIDTTQDGMDMRVYEDYDSISNYAVTAVQWAVNSGIMQGYGGNLMPGQPCTRAQIMTMLYHSMK